MKSASDLGSIGSLLLSLVFCFTNGTANGQQGSPAAGTEFFEKRIRPVLVERCYRCHNSSETNRNGLAVDYREAIRKGGSSGPAVVPGDPDASLLLQAIRHATELRMPKDEPKLEADIVADFRAWIEMGAPDPRDAPPSAEDLSRTMSWEAIREQRKRWWSFQPIHRSQAPVVSGLGAVNPIDAFVEARIERAGSVHGLRDGVLPRRLCSRCRVVLLDGIHPVLQLDEFEQAVHGTVDGKHVPHFAPLVASERDCVASTGGVSDSGRRTH